MAEADSSYTGKGLVKEVQSGDCLTIIVSGGSKGTNNEIVLTLASLDAPRLSRRSGDAPFAHKSREFLRDKCAGQLVTFKVEYKVPTIGRTFGTVFVKGEDVSLAIVEAGLAAVKDPRGDCSGSIEALLALQEQAKAAGLGMWTSDKSTIAAASVKVRHAGDDDVTDDELEAIFKAIEDKPVEAIIEYVRDGAMLRALLVDYNIVVPFGLAGVACPSFRGKGVKRADGSYDDSSAKPEPFAAAAKRFTEMRLLSRRVNIRCLAGPKKLNTFFGKVEHPKGDISAEILKAGFGRISDFTLKYTSNRLGLRKAEQEAKDKRLRVWKDYTPPETADLPQFQGTVVEVTSGDSLAIEDASGGDVVRVSLSSIRVPFAGTRDGSKPAEPFAYEARELLRNLAIGKRAVVSVDYVRRPRGADGAERADSSERQLATVLIGKVNPALELVKRGLATVVRHRGDEPRSPVFDELLDAENAAEKAKLGTFGNAKKAATAANDVTRDAQKAKQYMSFLTRPGERVHEGVVEYVFNGGRFKVHIPKENVVVAVSLIGVATPRTARPARANQPAEPAEDCADEAFKFVKRAVMNNNVTIDIEDADDRGVALATVFVKLDGKRTNLNLELVKRGYARVAKFSADKTRLRTQLYDAMDAARDNRIGMWKNFTPKPRGGGGGEGAEAGAASALEGKQRVHVSHIDDGGNFYITVDGSKTAAAVAELQAVGPTLTAPADGVKSKSIVAIDFNGEWCRVRVDKVTVEKGAEGGEGEVTARADITYIDFGNKETVPVSELRELPEALAKLPGMATKAYLAFVRSPPVDVMGGQDAGTLLNELTWDTPLVGELLPADDDGLPVILYNAADMDASVAAAQAKEAAAAAQTAAAAAAPAEGDAAAAVAATAADGETPAAAADGANGEEDAAAAGEDDAAAGAEKQGKEAAAAVAAPVSVNETMVQAGLARFRRPRQRRGFGGRDREREAPAPKGPHAAFQHTLLALENEAHGKHVGIWQYGDPGEWDEVADVVAPAK